MDLSNYEIEEDYSVITEEGYGQRIKIPRSRISVGQKIYQLDSFYEEGIQEIEVRGIEEYKVITDPQTGEHFCRPLKEGESLDGYQIVLGDGWSTHPYEKYLTKEDAYEAAIQENLRFIKNTQAMIDSWERNIIRSKKIINNIEEKLRRRHD